ncbi:MAG TPA: host-nuclease inhibitor Gam family protein [Methylophilaceae bacterium]|nr:host-nuclease inhibitor Gam family protein [Methylophilaceae bacterium]
MKTLVAIESKTKEFADARAKLAVIVTALNDSMEALKRQYMADLKRAVAATAKRQDELKGLLEASPELFAKPRSVIFHGIKVGYAKGKGKIEFTDPEQVVKLIKKNYKKDEWETMINVTETPIKKAIEQLSVSDLKKIGCLVTDAQDEVVIKATDTEVDKLVTALLKGATEEVVN